MESNEGNPNFLPLEYRNGHLFCENLAIDTLLCEIIPKAEEVSYLEQDTHGKSNIKCDVPPTPLYIYSTLGIQQNVANYVTSLHDAGLQGKIGYAIKANPNIKILEKMKSFGIDMIIAVSGFEVLAALHAGFSPENIILNGNGKQKWEVKLAIEHGVMMNVDSLFDAQQIVKIHEELNSDREVQVFLRVRPVKGVNQSQFLVVHEYVNTAENSKFGFDFASELDRVLEILLSSDHIKIIGVHCHFGSGIADPKVYEWLGATVSDIVDELHKREVRVTVLNVGGGIGINYFEMPPGFTNAIDSQNEMLSKTYHDIKKNGSGQGIAEVSEFLRSLSTNLPRGMNVIMEPGRSLIGKAGILLCKCLGIKSSNTGNLLVVDGSMNEVIRPCLYGAHHNILPIAVNPHEMWKSFDVVGPICESADFLGKHVPMQASANYVAVLDCGAYCSSMSSNYNLKPRAAEILVDGDKWTYIRKRDTFQELVDKMLF